MGGYRKYISDKKQITYILTQNGIAIPVHFKFFRVQKKMVKKRDIGPQYFLAYPNIHSCFTYCPLLGALAAVGR